MRRLWLVPLPALLGFDGCSLFTSFDGLDTGSGPRAATSRDASADSPVDGGPPPLPPPKPPCDPAAKPAANALFVSPTGDDALAGTRRRRRSRSAAAATARARLRAGPSALTFGP